MSKDEIKTIIQKIDVDIFSKNFDYRERNEILEKIVNAMTKGVGIDLPPETKQHYDAYRKLSVLYELLKTPTYFNHILDDIVVPFLSEASQKSTFTLVVGPGDDDLNQFYPHDPEFQASVFDKYPRNAVFVFEGGEGNFAVNYTAMFDESEDNVKSNEWANRFLDDLARQFQVEKDSIQIEKPNEYAFLFTISRDSSKTLFVLYKGDYLGSLVEDSLVNIVTVTDKNFLVCGIHQGTCSDIFFNRSSLFYNYFHYYFFTHGNMPTKRNLKSRATSFRFNLQKLRNSGMTRKNAFAAMSQKRNGKEAMGYSSSRLCNQPRDACAEGVVNEGRFWEGLGGKRKQKRKSKTKKLRKH